MHSADVRLVIGTRPEALKLAPVAAALAQLGVAPSLIFTGQHDLDGASFGLDRYAATHLNCPGQKDPLAHAEAVSAAMRAGLRDRPDLIVVQGDTSSALGGARAAAEASIALAHVEAGLRSFDARQPWPEEDNRVEIDRLAALLFAPTETSAANLRAEAVTGAIHVTGNTSIDAVLAAAQQVSRPPPRDGAVKRLLVTCHRRESWGDGFESIAAALVQLAREPDLEIALVLHPSEFAANRMRRLLAPAPAIRLLPPCSHLELIGRMQQADLILSDSGGIQEEAPALGVPLLVLRDKTERPEAIACGSARLVGTNCDRIVQEALTLLRDPVVRARMSRHAFPYGDGNAAARIAAIIAEWLSERTLTPAAPLPSRRRA